MLSVVMEYREFTIMLIVVMSAVIAEGYYAECKYAERCYAECRCLFGTFVNYGRKKFTTLALLVSKSTYTTKKMLTL
jgi:hypothetical protein